MSFSVRVTEEAEKAFADIGQEYPYKDYDLNWLKFLKRTKEHPQNKDVIIKISRVLDMEEEEYILYNMKTYRMDKTELMDSYVRMNLGAHIEPIPDKRPRGNDDGSYDIVIKGVKETVVKFDIPFSKENLDKLMALAPEKGVDKCLFALWRLENNQTLGVRKDTLYIPNFEKAWMAEQKKVRKQSKSEYEKNMEQAVNQGLTNAGTADDMDEMDKIEDSGVNPKEFVTT